MKLMELVNTCLLVLILLSIFFSYSSGYFNRVYVADIDCNGSMLYRMSQSEWEERYTTTKDPYGLEYIDSVVMNYTFS